MKKLLAVLLTLALGLSLSACGHFVPIMPGSDPAANEAPGQVAPPDDSFNEQPLMAFIGWDDFASSYYDDTPVALSVAINGGYASPVFDRTSIISACDALRGMTVTGRANPADSSAVNETVFTFTMADGDERAVSFGNGNLRLYAGDFTVTGGEALWDIVFPGYNGGFDVFDLYLDEGIRAFADGFGENTPISVGRRSNGGAILTSEDPEVVRQVFSLLAGASINRVEMSPDQNIDLTQTTDYVFTMADASYVTFSFTGPCLAVTNSTAYGPVYYWLNGIDELSQVTVLPQITIPTFEGGAITGMRDEIAQASNAAAGLLDGITVDGVYVDYNIYGEHGYLTLNGDTAISFVRQVTAIPADGSTTTPIGEDITVFVTLSDQSGPIIVFNGDTVQQMVGINHPCNTDAMNNLRSTILELAKDEMNVSKAIEESTG